MKSIILIAAPAAGKGTEASLLKEKYNIPHISTGDILREKALEDSPLGKDIHNKISNGLFVSDELILEILKERIMKDDCNNGYILDGFPRNLLQAKSYQQMLEELGKELGNVIVIDIDKNKAATRIASRLSCPRCKKVYNTLTDSMKPKKEGICDSCGEALIKRADDNEETYINRYDTYMEKTSPLIDFYEELGVAYHVDGNGTPEETHKQVVAILGE